MSYKIKKDKDGHVLFPEEVWEPIPPEKFVFADYNDGEEIIKHYPNYSEIGIQEINYLIKILNIDPNCVYFRYDDESDDPFIVVKKKIKKNPRYKQQLKKYKEEYIKYHIKLLEYKDQLNAYYDYNKNLKGSCVDDKIIECQDKLKEIENECENECEK